MRAQLRAHRGRSAIGAALIVAGVVTAGVAVTGAWFTATTTGTPQAAAAHLVLGEFGDGADGTVAVSGVKPMSDSDALDANNANGTAEAVITIDNDGDVDLSWGAQITEVDSSLYLWPDTLRLAVQNPTTKQWSTHDAAALFDGDEKIDLGEGVGLSPETDTPILLRAWLREDFEAEFAGWEDTWRPTFTISASARQAIQP